MKVEINHTTKVVSFQLTGADTLQEFKDIIPKLELLIRATKTSNSAKEYTVASKTITGQIDAVITPDSNGLFRIINREVKDLQNSKNIIILQIQ